MNLLRMWENRKKVLGMNERNLSYIRAYNSPIAKRFADDKLLTKKILAAAGIPTPKLLGVINNYNEVDGFDWDTLPKSFVIKPVRGLEGGGIEIFFNRDKNGNWIKANGSRYSLSDLKALAADIIDGKFSLHNEPDRVFFEERVKIYKGFQYYSYKGVPDVRIIVFNSIPIMSYVRLPTRESDGKANLAIGAIGVGIDIATGVTTTAIKGKAGKIEYIPGTNLSVSGLKIPFWNRILEYAISAQRETGLGLVGVDFLIDREVGPMIVELNARPGLSIQLANSDGLSWRLRKARGLKVHSSEKGVRLGKDLFGGDIEEDIERISGKSLIGIYESIKLFNRKEVEQFASDYPTYYKHIDADASNISETARQVKKSKLNSTGSQIKTKEVDQIVKTSNVKAKIDTGADSTSIDKALWITLGYSEIIEAFETLKHEMLEATNTDNSRLALDKSSDQLNDKLALLYPGGGVVCKLIISSHGRSIRLYMDILLQLGNYKFITSANVYDREQMQYKVIVGRKSLNKFLVEPGQK